MTLQREVLVVVERGDGGEKEKKVVGDPRVASDRSYLILSMVRDAHQL